MSVLVIDQRRHDITPGDWRQTRNTGALRFGLQHPLPAEALEHFIGLQHEGALLFRTDPLQVRAAHPIGALEPVLLLMQYKPRQEHVPPRDSITEEVGI